MKRTPRACAVLALTAALAVPLDSRAGLFSSNEVFVFEIDEAGFAKPVQYSSGLDLMLASLRAIGLNKPGEPPNAVRGPVLARMTTQRSLGLDKQTPEQIAAYTCDLIRLEQEHVAAALNLLQPLTRDPRRGGYLAYAHLARAHAARGEWREAADRQETAIRSTEFPTKFALLTKPQLAWLKRVEREYYFPFLTRRAEDARSGRPRDLREEVDALFPAAVPPRRPESPVRFVDKEGKYKAGSIPDDERKKLPPDALAIVQQLVLWHPNDARLYWLLGELYNAEGEVETAAKILDYCTNLMQYSNPILRQHRQILQEAAATIAKIRAEELAKTQAEIARQASERDEAIRVAELQERELRKRRWWIGACFVGLAIVLIYYQGRELLRRFRGR